jgi:P4 family phage/plasmid primase-like protien
VSVECVQLDGPRYELADLEGWLGTKSNPHQKPILQRRVGVGIDADAPTSSDDNPFTKQAHAQGYHPPIDVDVRLAVMTVGGAGDTGVNATQRDVTASLISRGETVDAVVERVLTATQALAGTAGWDWRKEHRKIHNLCLSWLHKKPEILEKQAQAQQEQEQASAAGDGTDGQEGATVHDLGAARQKKQQQQEEAAAAGPKVGKKLKRSDLPYIIADGVIDMIRLSGYDIMHTEGDTWLYENGFWRLMTPGDEQRIRSSIQIGFDELQARAKPSDLNAAWLRIMQHPSLTHAEIPWAGPGAIVCTNGVLDLVTGAFTDHSPENYARHHIGAAFKPGEDCPIFRGLLADMFSDQDDGKQLVDLVQEWMGSALSITSLAREQRRALILIGPSRTGKTQLAAIAAALIGDPIAGPSVEEVSEDRFALASIYGANAWIRDDAVNEGDKLDPQRFKTIVTGEPINIREMYKTSVVSRRFNIPVLLTCNTKPAARDFSDAVANRSLIVSMTNVYNEDKASKSRKAILGKAGGELSAGIFEKEASGILNFALLGFARLRARGYFDIPKSVATALQLFKDENNPVGEWGREAIEAAPGIMVARADLLRAYHGWERDREGDAARLPGTRWLLPKLRSHFPGLKDRQNHAGIRYLVGVKLTKIGLSFWDAHGKDNPKSGHATTVDRVNQVIGDDDEEETEF